MRFLLLFTALTVFISSCSVNKVKDEPGLEKFFTQNNVKGSFAWWNNGTGKIHVYNFRRFADSAYSPASTFKIVNSLIGLQTGVISGDTMVIKWDGVKRWRDAWNKDLTMYEAFRESAVPYYQEVARRIGRDTMQSWLDTLAYGNKKIGAHVDSFWLNHTLTITPSEQLGLMKKLYFDQLPFHKHNMALVRKAMLFEDDPHYKLSYKTGWTGWDSVKQRQIGWITGWIEENKHPYFFVLNLESADRNFDMPAVRLQMLKDMLKEKGFMRGKM